MKKIVLFIVKLIKTSHENDLFALANELTYKLLLALFPFLIFIMSVIAFFNIDPAYFMQGLSALPDSIYNMINNFITEVIDFKSAGVLSLSLLIAVYSSSSGFLAVMKGINKAYGEKETRNFVKKRLVSILLVVMFTVVIIVSIISLVFGDIITKWLNTIIPMSGAVKFLFGFFGYLITLAVLLFSIIIIYLFATSKKVPFYSVIPGALTTLVVWIIASKLFNIYINNFARYSTIYGSVGSIFILMYWLNIISLVLLVGGAINALLL